jgi:hypothetical protein
MNHIFIVEIIESRKFLKEEVVSFNSSFQNANLFLEGFITRLKELYNFIPNESLTIKKADQYPLSRNYLSVIALVSRESRIQIGFDSESIKASSVVIAIKQVSLDSTLEQ